MSLCIIYSTITVSNANSNKYTVTRKIVHLPDHRAHRDLGLDESEFTKSVLFCMFYFILGHITSVNNVVVTGLYLFKKSTHTSESSHGHLR